jgi:hypothetical protein
VLKAENSARKSRNFRDPGNRRTRIAGNEKMQDQDREKQRIGQVGENKWHRESQRMKTRNDEQA